MHCIIYIVLYALYYMYCILCIVFCALYSIHYQLTDGQTLSYIESFATKKGGKAKRIAAKTKSTKVWLFSDAIFF